ncbi:SufD family Fe-S cluster assembly protein, partial [Candidatus Geothermarchaeota archaeon]
MLECKERAKKAINKPPLIGPDIPISKYLGGGALGQEAVKEAPELAYASGIDLRMKGRAATYVQIDQKVVMEQVAKMYKGKIELMSIKEALERYNWLEDYWWRAVPVDQDKFTALVELKLHNGYFIRILPGQKVDMPIQACLLIYHDRVAQNVHNIIIAEPGSEAHIITGCMIRPISTGLHVGVTEFYLKRGSKVSYTMIHSWSRGAHVRPRSAAILDEGAVLINNYVNLRSVGSIQAYPTFYCRGNGSRVSSNSILFGDNDSLIDVGNKIVLEGVDSRGEIISRSIAKDKARMYARGLIVGKSERAKGHFECRGLLLSDNATIHAVPELIGTKRGSELSHEAAIGKISREQIEYLMARGLSMRDATSLIVKGFL